VERTVSARLHRSLNISNTLHGNSVLIVSVDILILQLANLVKKNPELVRHVGDILVARLTPDGELLLYAGIWSEPVMTDVAKVGKGGREEDGGEDGHIQQLPCVPWRQFPSYA